MAVQTMLISQDLMRHLASFVEPPAQLCMIRVIGSDHEYVFRVRYGEAHLDYPFTAPLYTGKLDWDDVTHALAAMSAMVVPPGDPEHDRHAGIKPAPCILPPMPYEHSPYFLYP